MPYLTILSRFLGYKNDCIMKNRFLSGSLTLLYVFVLLSCSNDSELQRRALELCRYIPNPDNLEYSKPYLTNDFYNLLDETFSFPSYEILVHEWEFYFVTADGTHISQTDYSVSNVEIQDETHAIATIRIEPAEADYDTEEHLLYMQLVDDQWLMSDFDNHKQDFVISVENSRKEQYVRNVIGDYLCSTIGSQYAEAEVCVPVVMIVATDEADSLNCRVWGDYWVFNYHVDRDTLKTVSGGNHSGLISLVMLNDELVVKSFEQTVDGTGNEESAKRIFGDYFDIYQAIHSNPAVCEAARAEQLRYFASYNSFPVFYYQDFGCEAVRFW